MLRPSTRFWRDYRPGDVYIDLRSESEVSGVCGDFTGSAAFVSYSKGYITTCGVYSQGARIATTISHVAGAVLGDHERLIGGNHEGICSRRTCAGYTITCAF